MPVIIVLYYCFLSFHICLHSQQLHQEKIIQEFIYTTHLPKDIANNKTFSGVLPEGSGV